MCDIASYVIRYRQLFILYIPHKSFTKTITIESNAKTSSKILTIKGLVEGGEVSNVEQSMPLKKVQDGATPLEIK